MPVYVYAGALLFGTFISSVAQVFLKKAAMQKHESVIAEYLNPTVILSYMVFFGATLLGVVAYKGIPLSMGPVLEASSYIYVTVFGVKFFGEKLNKGKVAALILILGGITVYAVFG